MTAVHMAGARRTRARTNVGRRASECTGGRNSAEKSGAMMLPMPSPMSSAFGSWLLARHAVGDHGGEQGLDGAEHGDGEGRRAEFAERPS